MTGLATVDLSGLTPFQQVLVFIQMCLGNIVLVSWVMVYIRRRYVAQQFKQVDQLELGGKTPGEDIRFAQPTEQSTSWWKRRSSQIFWHRAHVEQSLAGDSYPSTSDAADRQSQRNRLEIRRAADAPRLINPSGDISEAHLSPSRAHHHVRDASPPGNETTLASQIVPENNSIEGTQASNARGLTKPDILATEGDASGHQLKLPNDHAYTTHEKLYTPDYVPSSVATQPNARERSAGRSPLMPRTHTIELIEAPRSPRHVQVADQIRPHSIQIDAERGLTQDKRSMRRPTLSLPRSVGSSRSIRPPTHAIHADFGGFPMPHRLLSSLFHRCFPKMERKLTRTLTIPRTETITSQYASQSAGARPVPYISFEAVVGRNSSFKDLTEEQMEELASVEYRALTALLWIVGGYHIAVQLLAFAVIAPYMCIRRWSDDFKPPILHRNVSPAWFSAFQVVSAFSNSGLSLEDTSMVPFQEAYPTLFLMGFLILAGNTAFPIFLRLTIWMLKILLKRRKQADVTLQFLLDNPRRCFIYLFPSHHTWILATILIIMNGSTWFFFLILDLGNPAITSIPAGVRVAVGLFQATAVRTAGFSVVSTATVAPAVKTLYVIMMYVGAYPIAMSIRSTNVYEEKSLGIYNDEDNFDDDPDPEKSRIAVWSEYLSWHIRKQLSFDMWWLATALFLICIIERDGLDDAENATWFNIFSILFELVTAYGTVGLSLGVPYASYSFSGALKPLSKLIICVVMLRGRHRGLPVAIDRAVMLSPEFDKVPQEHLSASGVGRGDNLATPIRTSALREDGGKQAEGPRPDGLRQRPLRGIPEQNQSEDGSGE
ncbi:TrkH-domain-containing protein [Wolfiporia cocos MD-104 SS10]|uniref:TrkH-domain-containing protein n=1 Tax=Wolfiporia cocos (strain MD-104) TaxID=742152 RepID=A0A2H3JKT4_WOLCO|nr:TrkH-domain-containing protein [Wolfiporia cocos MD-104 SS10]